MFLQPLLLARWLLVISAIPQVMKVVFGGSGGCVTVVVYVGISVCHVGGGNDSCCGDGNGCFIACV